VRVGSSRTVNMVQATDAQLISSVRDSVSDFTKDKPHLQFFCDDACIMRFLRARGLDPKKASVMLTDTLKW
jgi:CRAL/TRIO, N-terminal domain